MDSFFIHYILSYGGAAGLCLLLILLGLLVPKRYHERELADRDKQILAEQEKNRVLTEANDRLRDAVDNWRASNERLQTGGQLTNQLVSALIEIAGERKPPSGRKPPGKLPGGGGAGGP